MIYPRLPGRYDFFYFRIGGSGLGNCLFTYFYAALLAKQWKTRMVAPAWPSLRIGPMLRGERSLRRYGAILGGHPEEIAGIRKFLVLLKGWPGHRPIHVLPHERQLTHDGRLTIFGAPRFSFEGLQPHRAFVRQRLIELLKVAQPATPRWGTADHIAVHVRLGDFAVATPETGAESNRRIPLAWYRDVLLRVRERFPAVPIFVFSDGHAHELEEILQLDGVSLRREQTDVGDLLALAQAKLLIGSNSTFSAWAAFLGNMPSIWLAPTTAIDRPTADIVPLHYASGGFAGLSEFLETL